MRPQPPCKQLRLESVCTVLMVFLLYSLQGDAVCTDPGSGLLYNVTTNRRAGESPYLKPWDIDPHLGSQPVLSDLLVLPTHHFTSTGVIRVDTLDGTPLATVWNFAIHGTCWGPSQMVCRLLCIVALCTFPRYHISSSRVDHKQ
jgi:hypothetical protein